MKVTGRLLIANRPNANGDMFSVDCLRKMAEEDGYKIVDNDGQIELWVTCSTEDIAVGPVRPEDEEK